MIGSIESLHNSLIEWFRFLWPVGFPEQIGGRFPGLDDFPFLARIFLRHGGELPHRLIEVRLRGADIAEMTQGLGAPVGLVRITAQEHLVVAGGLVQEFLPLPCGRRGGRRMEGLGGLIEQSFGGIVALLGRFSPGGTGGGKAQGKEEDKERMTNDRWPMTE